MLKTLKQKSKRLFYKHKVVTRVTSMLLVFTLLFTSLPLGGMVASAAEVDDENTIITVEKELTEYRTEYSKTYLMSNNTLESVISANPMHYKNDSDSWVDIDSTLVLEETEDGEVYKNKAGGYAVSFPATNENGSSVKIESGEHTIEIELVEGKKSHARKDTSNKNKAKKLTKEQRKLMTASELYAVDSNQNSALEYNDIYENTNVRYDINPTSVKESVIITKAPNKKVSYSYNIKADGLVAQLNENDSISFYEKTDTKKQNAVFVMPAPLMYDANDIYCYDIETTLKQKKGVYVLTYKPDYNWLKAKDRAYPVVLDPTTYVANSTQDAYTYSADEYQNRNIGSENQIKVGRSTWKDPAGDTFETFIRFDELPTIPDGYVINSALLMLTTKAYHGTWQELEVGAHKITEDWTNKLNQPLPLINYLNQPDAESFPRATAHIVRGEVDTEVGFEISALVNEWYEDPTTNYGVKLSLAETPPTDADNVLFHSSRATSGIPYLSITCEEYIPVTDIEITEKCDELELTNLSSYFDVAATVYPENATNKEVIWEVEDENIAYYNNGQIYGVNIGTTTVTAKSADNGEIFDSFELEVFTIPIESIQITNCPTDFLEVGQTHSFGFVLNPDNASHLIDPMLISWSSSNPAVAEFGFDGQVTAYSAGQTTITVRYAGFSDSYVLNVAEIPVTSVESTNIVNELTLTVGSNYFIDFEVSPNNATDKRAIATSNNTSIVDVETYSIADNKTIEPYFYLKAMGVGTTTVYVEFLSNPSINYTIEVTVIPNDMYINPPMENRLIVGQTWSLTSNSAVNVVISDTNILSTDGNGNITALSAGTTLVSVSDGVKYDSFNITVIPNYNLQITGIPNYKQDDEGNDQGELLLNQTHYELGTTITPAYSGDINWWSTDESVATIYYSDVRAKVILTAHKTGTTTICAEIPNTGIAATFNLTVAKTAITSVSISPVKGAGLDDGILYIGETGVLSATFAPYDVSTKNSIVHWYAASGNTNAVGIYGNSNYTKEKFTAQEAGAVNIAAKVDDVASNPFTITVKKPKINISNPPKNYKLTTGDSHILKWTVEPIYATVEWGPKKGNVAVINETTGEIFALSSGNTVIYGKALYEGHENPTEYTVSFNLTVVSPTIEITGYPSNKTFVVGESCNFSANIKIANQTLHNALWASSDDSILDIDPYTGKATALLPGTVAITAGSVDYQNLFTTIYCTVNLIDIQGQPVDNTLIVGQSCTLSLSNTSTAQNFVWISSKPEIASFGATGVLLARSAGTTTISATSDSGNLVYGEVEITVKDSTQLFGTLATKGLLDHTNLTGTDDGFLMCTKSLGNILYDAEIEILYESPSEQKPRSVLGYYDDWYLFSIKKSGTVKYGLIKMRELEHDNDDGNVPGVTVSFVGLDTAPLLTCINSPTQANSYNLLTALNKVTGPGIYDHDEDITNYFIEPASKAPYLIAEKYVYTIAQTANNGVIDLYEGINEFYLKAADAEAKMNDVQQGPENRQKEREKYEFYIRVPNALEEINKIAGYEIYNKQNNILNIKNKNNLTYYEKYAILATFTGNVNYNSFAAEVVYHAVMLEDILADIFEDKVYKRALRADMTIDDNEDYDINMSYYDLDSDIVNAQEEIHGVK